ncbi:MAG: M48 family metallopeptidase [Candidatus Eisenbacteria bacterium]|nr:M48 family metallopeptidase [Candidatus Eisenbacteria bacterium]
MNFFDHQERARRSTFRLLALFGLAVVSIIVGVYFAIRIMLRVAFTNPRTIVEIRPWWDPGCFVLVAAITVLFIGAVSLVRMRELGRSGGALALLLGGHPVPAAPIDTASRTLRNVVEEMAIASGLPPPEIYLLGGEEGINAFAAGHSPADAAVTLTRGALRRLSRDELQGVVAHEFSHILNGDMRMNLRIAGVLHGILAIGAVGRGLIQVFPGRHSGGRNKGGVPLVAVGGLVLILVGSIGTILGRMIQAAICRQREFLADSSAVQFTRNPEGIAGALKKIGGWKAGSRIENPKAEHAARLLFGEGRRVLFFGNLFATHPPLVERIQRIDPRFEGRFPRVLDGQAEEALASYPGLEEVVRSFRESPTVGVEPSSVIGTIGKPTAEHIALGAALLDRIPEPVREAVRAPEGALRVIVALLLSPDEGARRRQLAELGPLLGEGGAAETDRLAARLRELDPRSRLPLADIALPALRDLPLEKLSRAVGCVDALIAADEETTVFEFCLRKLLERRLRGAARETRAGRGERSIDPLLKEAAVLLGALASSGYPGDPEGAKAAFRAGSEKLVDPRRTSLPFSPDRPTDLAELGRALDRLAGASFPVKEKLIEAAAHTAFADHRVNLLEAELLRVVSVMLDAPLPPFLPEPTAD